MTANNNKHFNDRFDFSQRYGSPKACGIKGTKGEVNIKKEDCINCMDR